MVATGILEHPPGKIKPMLLRQSAEWSVGHRYGQPAERWPDGATGAASPGEREAALMQGLLFVDRQPVDGWGGRESKFVAETQAEPSPVRADAKPVSEPGALSAIVIPQPVEHEKPPAQERFFHTLIGGSIKPRLMLKRPRFSTFSSFLS